MKESEIEECLKEIMELTGCSFDKAKKVFKLVAEWTGGDMPDDW